MRIALRYARRQNPEDAVENATIVHTGEAAHHLPSGPTPNLWIGSYELFRRFSRLAAARSAATQFLAPSQRGFGSEITPICCMTEKRFATPQCSVIFPSTTRIASTASKLTFLPVPGTPRKSP